MDRWIDDDSAAPASVYPRIGDDDLVLPENLGFPELPGVGQPAVPHLAYRAVYGPEFRTRGIASVQPPQVLSAFPILVPSVDADGNETGRADDAGGRGAARHLHRLEPVPRRGGSDRRAVEHAGAPTSRSRGRPMIASAPATRARPSRNATAAAPSTSAG